MKKHKLYLLVLLAAVLGGCGNTDSMEAVEEESDVISVGDYDTSGPTTYSKIDSVNGYCFEARDRDLNGDFEIDPLFILNNSQSPKYINEDDYEYQSLFPVSENILVNTEDEYILYKPEECIYALRENMINGLSLLYYTEGTAEDEFALFLDDYNISSPAFDSGSYKFSSDPDTGFYECYEEYAFTMDGVDCMGFIYGVETDEGQTFFTAGGNINHLTDEELNYIAGSFGTNAEPGSLVEDTGQTDISYDLNGVLLTGTFSDRVGLMDSIDYSYAYADTDNFSEREPYFANPYSGVVGKYNVYALPEGTTLNEFLGVYPDSFEYSGQEAILDKSGGEWYCLDKECNTGDYNKTSLFVLIQADESIVFQIWYSDNIIKEDLIRGLSTVTTDIGESAYGSIPDSMAELYAEPVADEATPTDAAVELDIPSGDSGDGASDEKTVDVDVDGEILQLTPSDNYTED